jgi:hypothetical protein
VTVTPGSRAASSLFDNSARQTSSPNFTIPALRLAILFVTTPIFSYDGVCVSWLVPYRQLRFQPPSKYREIQQ